VHGAARGCADSQGRRKRRREFRRLASLVSILDADAVGDPADRVHSHPRRKSLSAKTFCFRTTTPVSIVAGCLRLRISRWITSFPDLAAVIPRGELGDLLPLLQQP
jgi:hypothetical protein